MRLSADIVENPNRRPYHLAVGMLICCVIAMTIIVGVCAVIG